jgi:hypothetical protein
MVLPFDNLTGGIMATDKMSIDARLEYLRVMQERYLKANRKDKAALLSQMEDVCGYHRKYLIARMNSPDISRHKRRRERTRTYGAEVEEAVRLVADALDWVCAERLQPSLGQPAGCRGFHKSQADGRRVGPVCTYHTRR